MSDGRKLEPAAHAHIPKFTLLGKKKQYMAESYLTKYGIRHVDDGEPLFRLSDIVDWIRGRREICADNGRYQAQYAMLTLANELEEFDQKTEKGEQ